MSPSARDILDAKSAGKANSRTRGERRHQRIPWHRHPQPHRTARIHASSEQERRPRQCGVRSSPGTTDKRGIGAEDGRLLDAVVQTHGTEVGAEFLNRMTKMTIAMCTSLGFTTGIDDEDLPPEAKEEINEINREASEAVDVELSKYGNDGRR